MCGIVGFISENLGSSELRGMMDSSVHRGPDSSGEFNFENVFLGHLRLSILDLSITGNQPMSSSSGRFTIVYNGEIYNNRELKKKLERELRGSSDTEILLESMEKFGLEKALGLSCGMFAFALWDSKEEELILARDRFGEKPLYYGEVGGSFIFGSELKSINSVFKGKLSIDHDALATYFKFNYIPTPNTIYKEVKKMRPSSYLVIGKDGVVKREGEFWSLKKASEQENRDISFEEAKREVKEILTKVLEEQMSVDVDYGAFLSGGIDSSLIVSLMQEISNTPVNSFSIGFENKEFNEAPYAKATSSILGTKHHELILKEKEVLESISKISEVYCEPFSDSSQIPTYLVSKMASEKVKVCLTGDAGDEVFGGYNRYTWLPKLHRNLSKLPSGIRSGISSLVKSVSPSTLQMISPSKRQFGENLHRVADLMRESSIEDYYSYVVGHCGAEDNPVLNHNSSLSLDFSLVSHLNDEVEKMIYFDQSSYLMDDILVKTDRASMANSLELRVPFLDRRIVEYSWSLPMNYKINNGNGKILLRSILEDYIPKSEFTRPKVGFGVPLDKWLRGELKDWAWELINPTRLKREGFLDYKMIEKTWNEHQLGKRNNQFKLWDVIMFQTWKETYY